YRFTETLTERKAPDQRSHEVDPYLTKDVVSATFTSLIFSLSTDHYHLPNQTCYYRIITL
ncbi:MAG: hypothetical protein WBA74_14135, partial [Cyclobacteriaceae bacterium]